MSLLRKKSDDFEVLDLTLLHKKGILKIPEQKPDILDLTAQQATAVAIQDSVNKQESNPFTFLDTFAQGAEQQALPSNSGESSDVNSLKIKLDDLEFKLERLLERLTRIDGRLDSLERP